MLRSLLVTAAAGAFLVIPLVSCGDDGGNGLGPGPGGPVTVNVTLREFAVDLSRTTLPLNTPIRFVIKNNGVVPHEFYLERAGAVDEPLEAGGREAEIEEEDLGPGATATLEWTFTQAGNYQGACHLPGHFEAGMVRAFGIQAEMTRPFRVE